MGTTHENDRFSHSFGSDDGIKQFSEVIGFQTFRQTLQEASDIMFRAKRFSKTFDLDLAFPTFNRIGFYFI